MKLDIKTTKTFTLSEHNIRELIANHILDAHEILIDPKSVAFTIYGGSDRGYDYDPARLESASVTIVEKS